MNFSNIFHILTNPQALIAAFGLVGVLVIVFLETGFFFGFFLPGDSLLFTAGVLASQGIFNLPILLAGVFLAATIGDTIGYSFGKRVGPALFTKEDSVIFRKEYIAKAQHFYEKYGAQTIILARFMPIIRTFAPIVAGIGGMKYKTFLFYNVLGGFIWTLGLIGLGYAFGSVIPDPDKYLWPAIIIIILLSAAPALKQIFQQIFRKK